MITRESMEAGDDQFGSYLKLSRALAPEIGGLCLLDHRLRSRGAWGACNAVAASKWLRSVSWDKEKGLGKPIMQVQPSGDVLVAMPLVTSTGELLAALCAQLSMQATTPLLPDVPGSLLQQLKPALDCLHRELAATRSRRSRSNVLAERTEELEWLFNISQDLKTAGGDRHALEQLLVAATERLGSSMGALIVPERGLVIEQHRDSLSAQRLSEACAQTQAHLLTWTQRRRRPLVINSIGRGDAAVSACKILSAPIMRKAGQVMGVVVFLNPPEAADYDNRQLFLARHIARQLTGLLEAQFDLMTGLYTRTALEQMLASGQVHGSHGPRSVIYVDIDRLHVVNEVHGFEIGDELIARVADLLTLPLLPPAALAGRLSGGCFAIVMPDCEADAAAQVANAVVAGANDIVIGPADQAIEVSVSCGVAALVEMPQGFARALAAAEVACKAAKDRGRNRTEIYACDDQSMMRRHDDVFVVGHLREALKEDRLMLYAHRIVPLRDTSLAPGFELLLRMRNVDGCIESPAEFMSAARRYQLLPTIDRWVVDHAFTVLAPYRGLLARSGIAMSINISGQSIGDESFIERLLTRLRHSGLPPTSLMIEVTEQTALSSLAKAADMMRRLRSAGCRIALDDFGTGVNSLAYLKSLPISRVKIDGSFIRDLIGNPRSEATVKSILQMVKTFGLDCVAEYVENEALCNKVRLLGIDHAQGFYYGQPEPLEAVLTSLQNEESHRMRALSMEI